jgi:predicted amidohydrolase YtcJ
MLSDAQNNTPAQLAALLEAARSRGIELSIHVSGEDIVRQSTLPKPAARRP